MYRPRPLMFLTTSLASAIVVYGILPHVGGVNVGVTSVVLPLIPVGRNHKM